MFKNLDSDFLNLPEVKICKLTNLTEPEELEIFSRVLREYLYNELLTSSDIFIKKNAFDIYSIFNDNQLKISRNINIALLDFLSPLTRAIKNNGIKEDDMFSLYPIYFDCNRVQNELNRINFFSHNKCKESELQIEYYRLQTRLEELKNKQSFVFRKFAEILNSNENLMIVNLLTTYLNKTISKELDKLSIEKKKIMDSLNTAQNINDSDTMKEINKQMNDFELLIDTKRISIEIIWREIALATNTNENIQQNMQIFSKSLELIFKGQPFEILDGDNFYFNNIFLKNIFQNRNIKMKVISILGPQNSGKSTLLNFMFGCDFSVNDGRCTRGIYGSLIKSNHKEFDYFLILDTEGNLYLIL